MRIASLDALRGIAAFAVAIPHFMMTKLGDAPTLEPIAVIAVEVFFVLSGFVLAPQILHCLQGDHFPRLRIFLFRRWMRTLPPYVLSLVLMAVLTRHFPSAAFFKYLFFVQNLWRIDQSQDFFPIAWSLSIEEWFYVVFPLSMLIARRYGVTLAQSVGIFFAAFFCIRIAGIWAIEDWSATVRRLVVFRLDSIAFGFALFVVLQDLREGIRLLLVRAIGAITIAGAAIVVALLVYLSSHENAAPKLAYFYAAPLFAISLLLLFYFHNSTWTEHPAIAKFSALLGNISYSVYLLHVVIMQVIEHKLSGIGVLLEFVIYVLALLAITYLLRVTFEQPILDARPDYRS